jgi:hypothetical protein
MVVACLPGAVLRSIVAALGSSAVHLTPMVSRTAAMTWGGKA